MGGEICPTTGFDSPLTKNYARVMKDLDKQM